MNVLVTGGAGFVGSVSVRLLADHGHHVTVLDTMERGHAEAVDPRARLVRGDVGDATACREALDGCEAVLHCAGYIEVAESVERPEVYLDNNVARPSVLVDEMLGSGVTALVFSSTAAVYGEPDTVPIPETHRTVPVNPYGESKLAFERFLATRVSDGLTAVCLRYFNAAGAWPDGSLGEAHEPETHIIPRLLSALSRGESAFDVFGGDYPTRDGTCVRDYVHVLDLAQAHEAALEAARLGVGGTFNLGSGNGATNLEVLSACAEATGRPIEPRVVGRRPGDPAVLVASSSAARETLGWSPERESLEQIIADAWRWHSGHPQGYRSA